LSISNIITILLRDLVHYRAASRGAAKRSSKAAEEEEDEEDEDLTADLEDPPPENPISEVKVTPSNAGKTDMQPSKPGLSSTYMDVDEAMEAQQVKKVFNY